MKVLQKNTRLYIEQDRIMVDFPNELFIYRRDELEEIVVLTTEEMVMKARSFLVFVMKDEAYALSTLHPDYNKNTFNKLMQYYGVDSTSIIDAMQAKGDGKYVLADYRRNNQ